MATTILFADNNGDFLDTRADFLEREGFEVKKASDPAEVERILQRENRNIDLAILDIRLMNDEDDQDTSGLELAKQIAPKIPTILLTKYPNYEQVREALGPRLDGLPSAVGFVGKREGQERLVTEIRKTLLKPASHFHRISDSLASRLEDDHQAAGQQARWNYWGGLVVALAGVLIVFTGAFLALTGIFAIAVSMLTVGAGIITEIVSALFFKRVDAANLRMDHYHRELLEIRRLENLLAATEEIPSPARQEQCKERIIETALRSWFGRAAAQANQATS